MGWRIFALLRRERSLSKPDSSTESGCPTIVRSPPAGGASAAAHHTPRAFAGKIPDPYYGTQENDVQWVAEAAWVFERDFDVDASWFDQASVYLNCDSLDTVAEVRVNDQLVGTSDNMFIRSAMR